LSYTLSLSPRVKRRKKKGGKINLLSLCFAGFLFSVSFANAQKTDPYFPLFFSIPSSLFGVLLLPTTLAEFPSGAIVHIYREVLHARFSHGAVLGERAAAGGERRRREEH